VFVCDTDLTPALSWKEREQDKVAVHDKTNNNFEKISKV